MKIKTAVIMACKTAFTEAISMVHSTYGLWKLNFMDMHIQLYIYFIPGAHL